MERRVFTRIAKPGGWRRLRFPRHSQRKCSIVLQQGGIICQRSSAGIMNNESRTRCSLKYGTSHIYVCKRIYKLQIKNSGIMCDWVDVQCCTVKGQQSSSSSAWCGQWECPFDGQQPLFLFTLRRHLVKFPIGQTYMTYMASLFSTCEDVARPQ